MRILFLLANIIIFEFKLFSFEQLNVKRHLSQTQLRANLSLSFTYTHAIFHNKVFLVHFRSKVSHGWMCVLKYILQKPCRKWAVLQYHCCQNECEIECSLKFHRLSVVKRNRTKMIVEYFFIFHTEVVPLSCVALCTHKILLKQEKAIIENTKYFYLKPGLSYCK